MQPWLDAFLLTQLIEIPIYLWLLRPAQIWKRGLLGFAATAVTHPVVWFALHRLASDLGLSYLVYVAAAECYAVAVEGLLLWTFKQKNAWRVALIANMASFGIGLLLDLSK
jgi:hypothetical protein